MEFKELCFEIGLNPVTKKNSNRILINKKTNKPFIASSKIYKQYEKDSFYFMPNLKIEKPIDFAVNVKAIYYRETNHRVDIANLHSALHDILVLHKILKDDNSDIVCSTDGSRVIKGCGVNNGKTLIIISKIGG